MYGHFELYIYIYIYIYIFIPNIVKINHFIFRFCKELHLVSSFLHTFPTFTKYGYDSILSKTCHLSSSLLLNAILLISSVNTLCASILNLCCDINMISSFCRHFYSLQT